MKGWSLKIKVTLVYTLFMTLLTCVSLGLLFSLSSQEILESVQKELEDRVYDSTEEISVKKEKLVPDRDFYNLEDGVYLSLYDMDGNFLFGRIPYGFQEKAEFSEGQIQTVGKEENKEEQKKEQEQQTSSQVTQTPVENTDVSALTSERILNSAALVPNAGFSVSDEYFDDAAFVGDSITEGIKLYEIMSNATVIAARGINLDNVFTDDQIRTAQGNTTVMGALEQANPKKIYIMFGANGVGWFTEEHFTKVYTEFVQKVKEQHPDSQIFLQSILPVTQEFDDSREDISNEKINRYNELVVEIAEKEEVYYLDVASAIKDEKGCLPQDSNGDGMHFGGKYYNKWFDYLKTHTIKEQ